jgi:ribosomal protein S18 acetylase RimI-like enzyme
VTFLDSRFFFLTFRLHEPTQLRRINTASFPIQYKEGFYEQVADQNDINLSKFAYWKNKIVGAICTNLSVEEDGEKRLYIMTLAVEAPYRGRGVGSQLLQSVLNHAPLIEIREIFLHVHVANVDAIRFYTDRFGFVQGDLLENYYRRIDPPHCYILYKHFDQGITVGNSEEAAQT